MIAVSSPAALAARSRLDGLRVLVAIASYGEKNLEYLRELIARYQALPLTVDVVVLSEAPKTLPAGVRVLVGLPSDNPWSLPFSHKPLFAQHVEDYDLFVYSEDDVPVTADNLEAFLEATDQLHDDEIPGFLRYEIAPDGEMWMPDAHGPFHWDPESVVTRGGQLYARYTNEHAAFYVLTREHLKRAIASGGFLRQPYEGKYDMLCAAATDPYTACGFRKLVGVSELNRYVLHHMSNRYAGRMGTRFSDFAAQARTLSQDASAGVRGFTLCPIESKLARAEWSKAFDEPVNGEVLRAVPIDAHRILSIGSGSGALEMALLGRGARVTVFPLDSISAAGAEARGLDVVRGTLDECFDQADRGFDVVVVANLLHLQANPRAFLDRCRGVLAPGGRLVVDSPNFDRFREWTQRTIQRRAAYASLWDFERSGVAPVRPGWLGRAARRLGYREIAVRWHTHSLPRAAGLNRLNLRLGRLTAAGFVFTATRER